MNNSVKKCRLIACEIMFREVCYLLSQTHNIIDVVFMQKGLHDAGKDKMKAAIQEEIDKSDPEKYDCILLGYGLCNNGICGLHAKVPLVIPRAHDCITLFLGSKERYREYFNANPGTYYKSSGWIERENNLTPQGSVMESLGLSSTYEEYVEQYGEENARYIMETLGDWTKNYTKMAFIDTSAAGKDGNEVSFGDIDAYRLITKQKAEEMGWQYEEIKGDIRLIDKLINCDWNEEDFQIIPPGGSITATNTDKIVSFE